MSPRTRRATALLSLAAVVALGTGVAGGVARPDQASDRAQEARHDPTPRPTGAPGEANDHGEEVSAVAHDDSLHGCEKGMAVADVASGGAAGPAVDPCSRGGGGGAGGAHAGGGSGRGSGRHGPSSPGGPPAPDELPEGGP